MRKYDELVASSREYNRKAGVDSIIITPGTFLQKDAIRAEEVSKGYGDRLLIDRASFEFPAGAVIGIIGPNGAGKTTLFDMIMGKTEPDRGKFVIGNSVQAMYVDQSRDGLDGDATVFDELSGGDTMIDVGGREISSRAYCSWFNFKGSVQNQPVSTLSGGERNRLQLAKTLRIGGNVLLLDEPSNDLDVDTLRALETAIQNFAGTVVCISHDRWFLDRIATHILAYEGDSKLKFFEGSYSEYEEDRIARTGSVDPTKATYKRMPKFA